MMEVVQYLTNRIKKRDVPNNVFEKILIFFKKTDLDGNGKISAFECFCILPKLEKILAEA